MIAAQTDTATDIGRTAIANGTRSGVCIPRSLTAFPRKRPLVVGKKDLESLMTTENLRGA